MEPAPKVETRVVLSLEESGHFFLTLDDPLTYLMERLLIWDIVIIATYDVVFLVDFITMEIQNRTMVTELILLGFSYDLSVNGGLFIFFLVIYIITIITNNLIIVVILTTSDLHTPMYYFLCILSFMDLCISTTVVPRLLADLISTRRTISLGACALQFYTSLLLGGTECLILAIMAYDRYLAICRPLHYPVLMRWSICYRLTAIAWIFTFFTFVFPSFFMPIDLCSPNQVNHFMCEILAVTKLACVHVDNSELVILLICFLCLFLPFVLIIVSYACIISSVLKIQSAGRFKAFSTCTSHILVVVLFFGTGMLMYFGSSSEYSTNQGKYISVFYNVICPMLNPLIYTLNNKDVKLKMKKMMKCFILDEHM
ncbi:olfactory receptor 2G3-like [Dendropsophus ebraccatus]|uniref:olfactory receptor 2G3-like n=1 Tax=Dendropsophus ebraccatus TaxID=150705 RepID=UPI0038321268